MARGSPTDADRVLVDHLAAFGYRVKPATFEYWRGQGALPRRIAPGRGRGRGRGSEDPPESAELALGICRFLDKSQGIPDRPDLPRRRRVVEAPLWLWYERYPIPNETIRDAVGACYLELEGRLSKRRAQARIFDPGAETYELPVMAADAEVAEMLQSDGVRRQSRAFARLRNRLEEAPVQLARRATSQLLQALQGHVDVEATVFPVSFEYPLVVAKATDQVLTPPSEAQDLADALAGEAILREVASLRSGDWRDVREVLRAIQGAVIQLAGSEDAAVRRTAREFPLANNATRLIGAVGALAVNLETIRRAVN